MQLEGQRLVKAIDPLAVEAPPLQLEQHGDPPTVVADPGPGDGLDLRFSRLIKTSVERDCSL